MPYNGSDAVIFRANKQNITKVGSEQYKKYDKAITKLASEKYGRKPLLLERISQLPEGLPVKFLLLRNHRKNNAYEFLLYGSF